MKNEKLSNVYKKSKLIFATNAKEWLGEEVTVIFSVKSIYNGLDWAFAINSEKDFKSLKNFSVFVEKATAEVKYKALGIEDLATYFKINSFVLVTGIIEKYTNRLGENLYQIKVKDPKQIQIEQSLEKVLNLGIEERETFAIGVNLEMVLIPTGMFVMGSSDKEKYFDPDELGHIVIISNSWFMGKYEVTQEQWEGVMGSNPSRDKGSKLPVNNVSWNDCQEFIKKLNAKTKGGYRLPTEAEWEYAGRAGTTTAYSFGGSITTKDANISESKILKPVAVGSYKPNAFGLYDMHGNVWEWVEDWYGEYSKGPVTDPKGPVSGDRHVLRGGSFGYGAGNSRLANRVVSSPDNRVSDGGFRFARTP